MLARNILFQHLRVDVQFGIFFSDESCCKFTSVSRSASCISFCTTERYNLLFSDNEYAYRQGDNKVLLCCINAMYVNCSILQSTTSSSSFLFEMKKKERTYWTAVYHIHCMCMWWWKPCERIMPWVFCVFIIYAQCRKDKLFFEITVRSWDF